MSNYLSSSLVILGAYILIISLIPNWRLIQCVKNSRIRACWYVLGLLTLFFIVGYFSYLFTIWSSPPGLSLEMVVPFVFFFGACFVWLVNTLSLKTASELEFQATHDPLTLLPNRRYFQAKLKHALIRTRRKQETVVVFLLDLDRFKHINDSLGHAVGDGLIRKVAEQLKRLLRSEDTVARLGGDEFLIMIEGVVKLEETIPVLEKLIESISEDVEVEGHRLSVAASIGAAVSSAKADTVDTLIKNADAALYRAKAQGGSTFCFYEEAMTAQALEWVVMEQELRRAVANNELKLFYQPQVDLEKGCITDVEALLRWEHPREGLLAPERFIPIAETCGLIVPVGSWVLRKACEQAQAWCEAGVEFGRIAVNVSALQLQRGSFYETLQDVLEETGLSSEYLELELTETVLMKANCDNVLQLLSKVRALGVNIAIDDFGAGYSSLAYLKQFPIDKLKLDKQFINDVEGEERDAAITRAVIGLARALGSTFVAEGVETKAQQRFLMGEGAVGAQGYLFGKPSASLDNKVSVSDELSRAALSC